jgi:hypothetical protein
VASRNLGKAASRVASRNLGKAVNRLSAEFR